MSSPVPSDAPKVILGSWADVAEAASLIRFAVFVDEQGVPADMELDEFDSMSIHALALLNDLPVGTGRLLPDGHVGRMAVLREHRGRGIGAALLGTLMDAARSRGQKRLVLHAQTHALGFYGAFGFRPEGDVFMEAGLPHQTMIWEKQA